MARLILCGDAAPHRTADTATAVCRDRIDFQPKDFTLDSRATVPARWICGCEYACSTPGGIYNRFQILHSSSTLHEPCHVTLKTWSSHSCARDRKTHEPMCVLCALREANPTSGALHVGPSIGFSSHIVRRVISQDPTLDPAHRAKLVCKPEAGSRTSNM